MESRSGVRQAQRGSLWTLALQCIRALMRDGGGGGGEAELPLEHPRRAFNHYQLSRVELLAQLLDACSERFLHRELPAPAPGASPALVGLVRALVGAPPQLHHLRLLADFLLLMHQVAFVLSPRPTLARFYCTGPMPSSVKLY